MDSMEVCAKKQTVQDCMESRNVCPVPLLYCTTGDPARKAVQC